MSRSRQKSTEQEVFEATCESARKALVTFIGGEIPKGDLYANISPDDDVAKSIARFLFNVVSRFYLGPHQKKNMTYNQFAEATLKELLALNQFGQLNLNDIKEIENKDDAAVRRTTVYTRLLSMLIDHAESKQHAVEVVSKLYSLIAVMGHNVDLTQKHIKKMSSFYQSPFATKDNIKNMLNRFLQNLDVVQSKAFEVLIQSEKQKEKSKDTLSASSLEEAVAESAVSEVEEKSENAVDADNETAINYDEIEELMKLAEGLVRSHKDSIENSSDSEYSYESSDEELSAESPEGGKTESWNHKDLRKATAALAQYAPDFSQGFKKAKKKDQESTEKMLDDSRALVEETETLASSSISFKSRKQKINELKQKSAEKQKALSILSHEELLSSVINDDLSESDLEGFLLKNKMKIPEFLNAVQVKVKLLDDNIKKSVIAKSKLKPDDVIYETMSNTYAQNAQSANDSKEALLSLTKNIAASYWNKCINVFVEAEKAEHAGSALWAIDGFLANILSCFSYKTEAKKLETKAKKLHAKVDQFKDDSGKVKEEKLDKKIRKFTGCRSILFKTPKKKESTSPVLSPFHAVTIYK